MIGLVGLPGSGKSTVGRQLARRLQVPFFDSDFLIEQQLGCSIKGFFEREGESAFRDVEAAVIDQVDDGTCWCFVDRGWGCLARDKPAASERANPCGLSQFDPY